VKKVGRCPKCAQTKRLTRHHVFPKRFFPEQWGGGITVWLCRECHTLLEYEIPYNQALSKESYLIHLIDFLTRLR
jgi:hypothetical protein